MNLVFANQNKEDAIYPLTTQEIVEAQQQDNNLAQQAEKEGYSTQLIENIKVLCYKGKMVIPKKPTTPCSSVVSPLLTTSRDQASRRNSLSFDIFERSTNNSPITCQKVSQLPGEQMQTTQIWQAANKTFNHQPLGGIMCGSHRTIYPQGQGQDTKCFYVHHND